MNLITKYIFKKFAINIAIAIFVCITLLVLIQTLRFLDIVLIKGLPINILLNLIFLNVQPSIVEILPFIIVIAVIFTWITLQNSNELIAIKSFGVSNVKLGSHIIVIAVLFSILNFVLTGFFIPNSLIKYFNLRNKIENSFNLQNIEPGRFNQLSDNFTLYVKNINNSTLENVIIRYKHTNTITLFANYGNIETKNNNIVLNLNNVYIKEDNSTESATSFIVVEQYNVSLSKNNNTDVIRNKPREFSTAELINSKSLDLAKTFKDTDLSKIKNNINKEIIKRIINTLIPILFLSVCLYFLINTTFNRNNDGFMSLKIVIITVLLKIILLFLLNTTINLYVLIALGLVVPILSIIYLLKKSLT